MGSVNIDMPSVIKFTNPQTNIGVIANPAPLGLAGFAMTTFVLSIYNANLMPNVGTLTMVLPLALCYGGIAQFVAGLFEFIVGNTFGATAFCSYGAFWCSYAALVWYILPTFTTASAFDIQQTVGLYLLCWTIFTIYMFVAALRTSKALITVFSLLVPAFILLTAGHLGNSPNTTKAGGWFGIFCAFAAWYASAAIQINSTWGYDVLPIGHIGKYPEVKA